MCNFSYPLCERVVTGWFLSGEGSGFLGFLLCGTGLRGFVGSNTVFVLFCAKILTCLLSITRGPMKSPRSRNSCGSSEAVSRGLLGLSTATFLLKSIWSFCRSSTISKINGLVFVTGPSQETGSSYH